jgi:hypothetical protein
LGPSVPDLRGLTTGERFAEPLTLTVRNFSITQGKLAGDLLVDSRHADSLARHP